MNQFYKCFIIFFIGSVFGWLIEVLFAYHKTKKFQNRSSIIYGPFGYAYGIVSVLLTLFLAGLSNYSVILLFIISFIIGTIAEYIMSFGMELVYGYAVWDYSKYKYNIKGRVCLLYSIYWGILGMIWAKYISVRIDNITTLCFDKIGINALNIIIFLLVIDTVLSHIVIRRSNDRAKNIKANTEIEILLDKYYDDERLKRAFPQMFIYRR